MDAMVSPYSILKGSSLYHEPLDQIKFSLLKQRPKFKIRTTPKLAVFQFGS
jgi:hypothetical protein